MMFASAADVAIVTSLAAGGVLMTPLPPATVGILFATTLCFALTLDAVKIAVFARLRID
jgi:H+-transporting ATPase